MPETRSKYNVESKNFPQKFFHKMLTALASKFRVSTPRKGKFYVVSILLLATENSAFPYEWQFSNSYGLSWVWQKINIFNETIAIPNTVANNDPCL